MRRELGWLAVSIALLGVSFAGCGHARRSASVELAPDTAVATHNHAVISSTNLRDDGDVDGAGDGQHYAGNGADDDVDSYGGSYYDWDDGGVLYYGHPASSADEGALITAIERYYATSARGDGAGACRLLSASIERAVPREYGRLLGLPHERACAPVMTALLRELRPQVSDENSNLRIGVTRVQDTSAHVMLGFEASWPNRYMQLQREHGGWKIGEIKAEALP